MKKGIVKTSCKNTQTYQYRYVFLCLQKSRSQKFETEYLFYTQLKAQFPSSYLKKGEYLSTLKKYYKQSYTTLSTKMNRLLDMGFAAKVYKNGKHVGYQLRSYNFVWKNIFDLTDTMLRDKRNVVIFERTKIIQKKDLKSELEFFELIFLSAKVSKQQSIQSVPSCKQERSVVDPYGLSVQMCYKEIAQALGRKSKSSGFKTVKKLLKTGICTSAQCKEEFYPKNKVEAYKIRHEGGKRFYSAHTDKYYEQKSNFYSFHFQSRFPKYSEINYTTLKLMSNVL